jgi:hypothetical protein
VGLQGLGGGAWRILTPKQPNERVGRHHRTTVQPEHREDGARLGARNIDGSAVLTDLERSQTPSSTDESVLMSAIVGRTIQYMVKIR